MTAAELARLLGGKRVGNHYEALCPAHPDKNPSLDIEKDGKTLFICRAGCDQASVLAALQKIGAWTRPEGGDPRFVCAYDYVDENGKLLFQVVRKRDPKEFPQRRPDGVGGWIWNREGVRRVLYRLPEVIAARQQANGSVPRVYVVEGEKDADRLGQWGLLATTNPGGAGKWQAGFYPFFAGFDVVIIPDNDDAGRAHAQAVAAGLAGVAACVRIVALHPLPEKGDVSDWIDAGASQSDFETFVETIEPLNPDIPDGGLSSIIHDAGDIDVTKIPPREWLLGVTFCRTFISGLIGDGGVGKTAIRYAQYIAGATGRNDITGEYVHHRFRTLIVCLEDDLDEVSRRIGAAMLHHKVSQTDVKGWLYYCTPQGLKLLQEGLHGERVIGPLYEELKTWIKAKKIDVVGIDPFIKAHGVGESDNNAIDEVCTMLAGIAHEFKCAIDLVSHARKGVGEPGNAERERGASAKKDAGRLMRTVTAMSDDEAKLFNAPEDERPSLVRVDDAKVNITQKITQSHVVQTNRY